MAGHARYTALLDACVLYPVVIADALLRLAVAGFYAPKWTTRIEDEWVESLERNRPDLKGRLGRREQMRHAVPDWEVPEAAWRPLESSLVLPDSKDRHVLAAAVAGHADCIVTANLKDFPEASTVPFGIEVVHPDTFIVAQWDLNPPLAIAAFKQMRAQRKRPAEVGLQFIATLERNGLPATSQRLRSVEALI